MWSRLGALLVQFCDGSLWYSLPYSQLLSSTENNGAGKEEEIQCLPSTEEMD